MKRSITFILTLVYFVVSTGFIVNVHYCAGKLSSIKIEQKIKKCCCKKQHKGCCKTEQKLVKLSSKSKVADTWLSHKPAAETKPIEQYAFQQNNVATRKLLANLTYNYPPPYKATRFALLHYCILRI